MNIPYQAAYSARRNDNGEEALPADELPEAPPEEESAAVLDEETEEDPIGEEEIVFDFDEEVMGIVNSFFRTEPTPDSIIHAIVVAAQEAVNLHESYTTESRDSEDQVLYVLPSALYNFVNLGFPAYEFTTLIDIIHAAISRHNLTTAYRHATEEVWCSASAKETLNGIASTAQIRNLNAFCRQTSAQRFDLILSGQGIEQALQASPVDMDSLFFALFEKSLGAYADEEVALGDMSHDVNIHDHLIGASMPIGRPRLGLTSILLLTGGSIAMMFFAKKAYRMLA